MTGSVHPANSSSTRSTIKERPSLLVGPPALFSKSPPSSCHRCPLSLHVTAVWAQSNTNTRSVADLWMFTGVIDLV